MPLRAQMAGGVGTIPSSPPSLVIASGMQGARSIRPHLLVPRSCESRRSCVPGGAGTWGRAAWEGFHMAVPAGTEGLEGVRRKKDAGEFGFREAVSFTANFFSSDAGCLQPDLVWPVA